MQKIEFMPPFLQDILQRYCKLVILSTLKTRWYQLCCLENFGVYLHAKNQVHSSPLFWNITKTWQTWNFLNWGCFTTPTKNNKITLTETFMFIYMQKNELGPSLLSWDITLQRILQSDWLRTFWSITSEPEFYQTRGLRWIINNKMIYLRLCRGKTMKIFFQKMQQTPSWVHVSNFLGK